MMFHTLLHRISAMGFLAIVLGVVPATAQSDNPALNAGINAVQRRQQQMERAEQLMLEGDRKYADRDFAGAVESYRSSLMEVPQIAAAQQFQLSVFQKYQETVPLRAEELARQGRSKDAIAMVDQFFQDAIAANVPVTALDSKTRFLLQDLKSGNKYEPALTPDHVKKIENVDQLFAEAEGNIQLGNYDKATALYAEILAHDPYNSAARRGMERVDNLVNAYHQTAYDQTRATMIREIHQSWENPVPRYTLQGMTSQDALEFNPVDDETIEAKLRNIILPSVEFEQTPLKEVVEFLIYRSRALDTMEPDPAKQGVNILISAGSEELASTPVTLRLTQVPLAEVLRYVTQFVGAKYRVEQYAVLIVPITDIDTSQMILKTFRVPPTFLSDGAVGGGGGGDPFANDPFAGLDSSGGGSALKAKLSAQEYLEQNGINFPEGASAQYVSQTSTLIIRNTQTNVDLVEALVENSFGSVEKLLKIEVRMLNVTDEKLKVFGFDWLLGQFNLPGNQGVFGSGGTLGSTRTQDPTFSPFPFIPPGSSTPVGQFPVTSGLRFDPFNALGDSVDSVLDGNREIANTGFGVGSVFAVSGVFTDPQFQVVLRALEQNMSEDLSTTAAVVSRPGQIASVRSVREFIYPSEYDPPEIPQEVNNNFRIVGTTAGLQSGVIPTTPAHPAAFETRELGTILEVEGSVSEDSTLVSLNLTPEIASFRGFINYGSPFRQFETVNGEIFESSFQENRILMPVFRTIRETTSVDVYDGHTIVIGGLVGEERNTISDKLPVLGDAPLVGQLFRSEMDKRSRKTMLFFVTVNVIDPSATPIRETRGAPSAEITSN